MAPSSFLLFALLLAAPQEKDPPAPPAKVKVRLGADIRLNPSKSMAVRFTIENATDGAIDVDEPADYLDGLEILDSEGKVLRPFGAGSAAKRTVKLEKGGFIGQLVDIKPAILAAKVPEGVVKLTWKHGDALSNTVEPWLVRDWVATLDTTLGEMKVEFLPEAAPRHVLNFIDLANKKMYDGCTFHRVIPGFMAQGGQSKEPLSFRLKAEFNRYPHDVGTLSMARTNEPDLAQSEFFICFARLASLDGKYTVFGQLVAGEPVLRKIEKAETDHSPCAKCGKKLEPRSSPCCGSHHEDRPKVDIVIKSVTVAEKESK